MGFEHYCPLGPGGPVVPDFIRYPWTMPGSASDHSRDIQEVVQCNRDYHYPRAKHWISDFKEFQGKKVVIVCPGPSVRKLPGLKVPDDTKVLTVNKASSIAAPDAIFITERHAKTEWIERKGVLVPWVPDVPVITSVDAAQWIADVWGDNAYYSVLPWSEFPQDPRALEHPDDHLFAMVLTPVMAMHFAVKAGASQIILVGLDLSLDMGGFYYYDTHARDHINRYDRDAIPCVTNGGLGATTPELAAHGQIMRTICYICERNGIPVINASGGAFAWRNMDLERALCTHEPIVCDCGETPEGGRHSGCHRAEVQPEVA